MSNDQWFEPGDKVIKVLHADEVRVHFPNLYRSGVKISRRKVYCVSRCWRGANCNLVTFVGIENSTNPKGKPRGFPAFAFRRVEEIKLCVRAAEKMKEPADALAHP